MPERAGEGGATPERAGEGGATPAQRSERAGEGGATPAGESSHGELPQLSTDERGAAALDKLFTPACFDVERLRYHTRSFDRVPTVQ